MAPGPVSLQTSSTTSTTTMSPTSTSECSSSSPDSVSSSSLTSSASPNALLQSSDTPSSSVSSSRSATSTSATPQPSSSPGILNFTVHNMTTCTSGLISWNYSGDGADLFLSITNIGTDQYYNTNQTVVDGVVQQQLADTNTSVSSWTWSSVNVTQGWYQIQGLVLTTPSINNDSAPFYVANGTNVACLTSAPSTSSASSSASTPQSSATSTTNIAGIVGGVVGAVVGLALIILAGVWLWSRRRKRPFIGGAGSTKRYWGSLKSTESSVQPGESGTQLTDDNFHARSESMGGMLEDAAGGKASAATTSGDSDENAYIMGEEKLVSPASSFGTSHFDALNTPVHYDRRASAYYSVQIPTPIATESSRSRSASLHTSNQSIEQQTQRIRSSMETSMQRRSERLSMPTLPSPALSRTPTHTQPTEEYALSPVPPVNRSISTGAVSVAARRAPRKPVPQYDPSVLLEDTSTDAVSTFTGGAESSQSHGTGMGAGASGTPTDLVHKASFGDGRPVHYLIPDMPLPQQD